MRFSARFATDYPSVSVLSSGGLRFRCASFYSVLRFPCDRFSETLFRSIRCDCQLVFRASYRPVCARFAPDFRTIRARFLAAQANRSEMRRVRVAFGEVFNVSFSENLSGHCVRIAGPSRPFCIDPDINRAKPTFKLQTP